MATFIDLHLETFELHRAALLLDRVCQDDKSDPDLETLVKGINTICSAAEAGRLIDYSAIEQIEEVLAGAMPSRPPADPGLAELIRYDVLAETQEFMQSLPNGSPVASTERSLTQVRSEQRAGSRAGARPALR